ncbi:MAG: molybdopterin molybdotransferase MoeA [Ignavibacteria bacterium]|jgi:molybdopterin molybdotransferase|nr:molybdopterin molybdotransferase MoeA [Ignavibacteria bacterium]MCU7497686.1 molybdopterin molybdotransferase MoeA [Ignavibacteria bacterium]MCU7511009.1 molybdopterin molybdotransferase MoeA [Ignavibacteria bacterium]MCU7518863.1 molybdopterin molybdotransferase MoeA [Ignavibacteria bacterium]MCU7523169.1 molybdopterin molybdotransferase MoeA [Ignavibacteria bacterium]
MISFSQANEIIYNTLKTLQLRTEYVSLSDAQGRTLAEDVISDVDLPPFNSSAMDGFAVKFDPGIRNWSIKGEIAAGNFSQISADRVSALAVMTGARLPGGFDTVIPVEDVFIREQNVILNTNARLTLGMNVSKRGQDLLKGQVAVSKNSFLKAPQIAALASCGKVEVKVLERLKIGVLATGDELIDAAHVPAGDKIRASNLYSILSAVKEMGMIPVNFGIAKDQKDEIKSIVSNALDNCDVLVTTGGVSVGKYDFVGEVLSQLGIKTLFHKINIKPGKPVLFGLRENGPAVQPVFGLPGNPVSSLVTFYLLVKTNVMKCFGSREIPLIKASLKNDIKKTDSKRHFIRGYVSKDENGTLSVSSVGLQSSGNLVQMSMSNCLITIEEGRTNPLKGEEVECIMI